MKFKSFILLSLLMFLIVPASNGQSFPNKDVQASSDHLLALEKLSLLSDLKSLDEQTLRLNAPLSRALVKGEIADAAWWLDREWAKSLLTKAYELTFPDEEERAKFHNVIAGETPQPPTTLDRARRSVRNRLIQIAAREKAFSDQLIHLGAEQLGSSEGYVAYTNLAENARQAHDMEAAGQYLLQAVDSDPSQLAAGYIIADIAKTDRQRADKLIIDYLERLRNFPLSSTNRSIVRIFLVLDKLIFPSAGTAPPEPTVMRAYVSYVIQSLGSLEEREPGSLKTNRGFLLKAWLPLKQYAPDLTADFMLLEQRSRWPSDNSSLTTMENPGNNDRGGLGNRIKDDLENRLPSAAINRAISIGDFPTAHKLVEKLSEGPQKNQLIELVNAKEVLYFLKKGDLIEARQLAEKLIRASSIQEVYPSLIGKCVRDKDQICATSLMLQAVKQLKNSDTKPPTLPAGFPDSILPTKRERDPILDGMAKLTLAVLPISEEMAMLGLDETIAAANVSSVDTAQGLVGFDVSIFKKLAPKNESRVQQAAESFKDPVRRIVTLAAIDQWKAEDLNKRASEAKAKERK